MTDFLCSLKKKLTPEFTCENARVSTPHKTVSIKK